MKRADAAAQRLAHQLSTSARTLAPGHVPQTRLRRVVVYIPDELYARLQTAAWVRHRRFPSQPYSLGAVVREVLEAVLPAAVPALSHMPAMTTSATNTMTANADMSLETRQSAAMCQSAGGNNAELTSAGGLAGGDVARASRCEAGSRSSRDNTSPRGGASTTPRCDPAKLDSS
jgi:hypothetical protein